MSDDGEGSGSKGTVSMEDFKSLESRIDVLTSMLQSLVDSKKDPPNSPPHVDLDPPLPGFVKATEKSAEERSEDNDSGSSKRDSGKGEFNMVPPPWYSPDPPIPHPHINNRGDPPKISAYPFGTWQFQMQSHVNSSSIELWRIIKSGYKAVDPNNLTRREVVDCQLNATALHMI